MNIFYLHADPYKAATYFYDKHKVKMILESAQMLCTAHHVYGNGDNVPYKKAHLNHPSTIWARSSRSNYYWLYEHMLGIGKQYTKRYGKYHLSIEKCRDALAFAPTSIIPVPDAQVNNDYSPMSKPNCSWKARRSLHRQRSFCNRSRW